MRKRSTAFQVDGYDVTASFLDAPNEAAIQEVKHILLSAFDDKKIRTFENNSTEDYNTNQRAKPEP